jgi:FecR protein
MRSRSHFCTTLVVFLLFCTALGQDPQKPEPTALPIGSATVADVKGKVSIFPPQGGEVAARRGQVVGPESRIETEKGSVLLALADGSQALVKSNSRVVLKDPNAGKGYTLELLLGRIVNKIQKRLGSNPSFRMGTPTAVITVRGTRFEVEVTRKLRTYVFVYEGLVEVYGFAGGAPPVLLRPGFTTNVESDHNPEQPREMGDFGERNGSEGRDREGFGSAGGSGSGSEREGQQMGERSGQKNSGGHEGPDN